MADTFADHLRLMRASAALEYAFTPARTSALARQFGNHETVDYAYIVKHFDADAAKAWERVRQARKDYFEAINPKQEFPA